MHRSALFHRYSSDTVQLYFTNTWGPCFPHTLPHKAHLRGETLPPWWYLFNTRPDAAAVRCYKGMQHCFVCFVSATQGNRGKFPDDHRRAVHIPLGRRGCWTWSLFSQPGGEKKKPNPPSTTHSDCSVQCCDQNASVHKASGKAAMPMDHEWTPDHKQVISTLQESRNPFFFFFSPNQIMHNKGPQDGPSWIAENRQKPQSMRQAQNESGANLFLILLLFTAAYSSFKYHSFLFLGWDTVRLVWAQS